MQRIAPSEKIIDIKPDEKKGAIIPDVVDEQSYLLAVAEENIAVVKKIVAHAKVNLLATDEEGNSALHIAVAVGNMELVETLLSIKTFFRSPKLLNLRSKTGDTPIMLALKCGDELIAKRLLKAGADLSLGDDTGAKPIHWAAANNCNYIIHHLAFGDHTDYENAIDSLDDNEMTPMHYAAYHGRIDVMKTLINYGANAEVNSLSDEKITPLHLTAESGKVAAAELLLTHDAEVDCCNDNDTTPLHIAAEKGFVDFIKLLLRHKADPSLADENGRTALEIAVSKKQFAAAEVLIEHMNCELHAAVLHGKQDVMTKWLDVGAKVNAKNAAGLTPLHVAVNNRDINAVRILLQKNADWQINDNFGISAKKLAEQTGQIHITALFDIFSRKGSIVALRKTIVLPELKSQFRTFDRTKQVAKSTVAVEFSPMQLPGCVV